MEGAVACSDGPRRRAGGGRGPRRRKALACWPGPAGSGFGPFPAMMERRGGLLRWQLLLQSEQRAALQAWLDRWLTQVQALASSRKVRWDLDLDPQEF